MIMTAGNGCRAPWVLTRRATRIAVQTSGHRTALARGLYADLMVTLAGSVAQQLAGYPDNYDGDDLANARNFAGKLVRVVAGLSWMPGLDEPQELNPGDPLHAAGVFIFERAWAETVTMLQDNWLAVMRVASALANHDQPTPAELDHVIAHGQRKPK